MLVNKLFVVIKCNMSDNLPVVTEVLPEFPAAHSVGMSQSCIGDPAGPQAAWEVPLDDRSCNKTQQLTGEQPGSLHSSVEKKNILMSECVTSLTACVFFFKWAVVVVCCCH